MVEHETQPGPDSLVTNLRRKAREGEESSPAEVTAAAAEQAAAAARKRRRRLVAALGVVLLILLGILTWQVVDVLTSATLIGRVADLDGRPIMGAVVEVEGSAQRVTSDEEGCFELETWPGDHWLLVQVPGESGVAIPVSVSPGARKDVGTVYLFRR